MEKHEIEAMLEAVLFAHGDPVGADRLAAALELPESLVADALAALQKKYAAPGSGLTLLQLGGHWQLATKTNTAPGCAGPSRPGGPPPCQTPPSRR